jgi:NitT/TauT family transport system permease protein
MNRYSVGSILGILLLWELLVRWLEIPKFLLPTPSVIISYIIGKFQLLASHTLMTFFEACIGFLVGSLSAIITAILFLWYRPLKEMFYPYAVILNSTPIVGDEMDGLLSFIQMAKILVPPIPLCTSTDIGQF